MIETITVSFPELPEKLREIHIKRGTVLRMAAGLVSYTLTVRTDDEPELSAPCECDICQSQRMETIEGSHLEPRSGCTSSTEAANPQENQRKLLEG
jgi:hypothetical protein